MRGAKKSTVAFRASLVPGGSEGLRELLLIADPDPVAVEAYSTSGLCYEALVDGCLAGAAVLADSAPGTSELANIAVRAEFRGHGTGRKSLRFLILEAQARGYTCMTVSTGNSSLDPWRCIRRRDFAWSVSRRTISPHSMPNE